MVLLSIMERRNIAFLLLICFVHAVNASGRGEEIEPIEELFGRLVELEHYVLAESKLDEEHHDENHLHEIHLDVDARQVAVSTLRNLDNVINGAAAIATEEGAIEYGSELMEFIEEIDSLIQGEEIHDDGETHEHDHNHDHEGDLEVEPEGPFQNALLAIAEIEQVTSR